MPRLLKFVLGCCAILAANVAARGHADEPRLAPTSAQPIRFARIPPEPIPLPPVDGGMNGPPLSLADVEALALVYHPSMRQAEGLIRVARGEWLQVGLRPNPEIGYAGNEVGDEGRAGQQGGYFSQEFVTAGKLGLSRAVAQREIVAADQRREQVRLQLITTVRMYYYEVLAAERSLALAHQLEQVGTQAFRASELRLKAREGTRAALLQSQVELDSAFLLVEQATNRREAARRRLASVTGLPRHDTPLLDDTLGDSLPALDWEATHTRLLAESPELAELRADVDGARWAIERASAGRVPNVTVQSGVQFDHATDDTIANLQIGMPLPVFNRNQGGIAAAGGQLVATQSALEGRQLALTQRLASAMRDYITASRRVKKYAASILPAARQSLELISTGYEQGELEYLDILAAQRTYTEKNLAYLTDLESAWKKWAEIDGLLVGPLPASNE